MNKNELAKFVGFWQRAGMMEQRMGYLYGYYSEDPNYPNGVRVNIEALYEPPQINDMNGFVELEDPDMYKADRIACALGLEKVGHIFTKIDQDTFLNSHEIRRAAQLQQQHIFDHPDGFKVSKYVTVVVQPKGDDVGVECYMVTDQCQALERDNVFGNTDDRKFIKVRDPGPDEIVPTVLTQGKPVKEIEPAFFIVSLAHG